MTHDTVGGYLLGEMLGSGGMGEVYAAQQPLLGRTVALKLLHADLAADPSMVERFRTEAVAGCRLSHPNVAGVIDFGVTPEGTPYLVMERVAGESLGGILEREGALAVWRACRLVVQLLAALDAAHVAGVIHADVKCDNLLVELHPDGREVAVLIDFGISRLAECREPEKGRADWTLSGTPEYLAPEVIAGAVPTAASDIYAAGIVLYELLCGSTPFRGASPAEIFRRHLEDDLVMPSLRRPDAGISSTLDQVVRRALAKDPAERFVSAAQFSAALSEIAPAADPGGIADAGSRSSAFSTEAPTQNWMVSDRRRLGEGTEPPPAAHSGHSDSRTSTFKEN